MKLAISLLTTLLVFAPMLRADEVVLKNGDHLTGTIMKLDDKKLVLKTDYADTVKIKWEAVSSFSVQQAAVVETSEQQKITVATLTRKDGNVEINSPSGQSTTIPGNQLKSLRSQSEEAAYERSLNPSLLAGWDGGANLGLAMARGNSRTLNLSTGMNLQRSTLNDKITMYSTTVYTKDDVLNAVTANAVQGGIRYDRNLNKKTIFGYVSADFQYDEVQDLDLRSILGSGLGWHAIASKATVLDVLFGGSWTREHYGTGLVNNIFSPSFGEQFSHKLSAASTFTEKAFIYPYVTGPQLGDYMFALDSGLTTKINHWLSWQSSISDRFVTNPLPGTKRNDLLLSTGFGVTIAGKKE